MKDRMDELAKETLARYMPGTAIHVRPVTESTNTWAKEAAAAGAPEVAVFVAERQTGGRGRRGRSFFSPSGGLYMSIVVHPSLPPDAAVRITTAAAVAVCRAAADVFGVECGIKWVNDVFHGGRKVCGILTEASTADGRLDWAVVGIGVNVTAPADGFPPEISDIAGALTDTPAPDGRARLAAAIWREFFALYQSLPTGAYMDEYRRRCFVIGRDVTVVLADGTKTPATAEEIDGECRLVVRYADGTRSALASGEISIKMQKDSQ